MYVHILLSMKPKLMWKKSFREETSDWPVAVKTLSRSPSKDEIEILKALQNDLGGHKHFANYLSMVWQSSELVDVLSPCAKGDLDKFFRDEENEKPFLGQIECLVQEIQHIAEALEFIHKNMWDRRKMRDVEDGKPNGVCCHMDLKPKNILVFGLQENTVGHWKLTDFGVSKVSELKSTLTTGRPGEGPHLTVTVSTRPRPLPSRYQAPEVEHKNESGRGSDVWSLGCIYVEAIAAGLGSLEELGKMITVRLGGEDYENDYFYHLRSYGPTCMSIATHPILKPRVKTWIENGFTGAGGQTDERQKSILSKSSILILSMLACKKRQRPRSEKVVSELKSILNAASGRNQPGT